MVGPPSLDPGSVRELARLGRVAAHERYHAFEHGTPLRTCVLALVHCFRVERDRRLDATGRPRHPAGFIALGNIDPHRVLRVDFNLGADANGKLIIVVTAFEVKG